MAILIPLLFQKILTSWSA